MRQITITLADDGRIQVESSEGGKPYMCKDTEECLQYLQSMLTEETAESPQEQATEGPEDYAATWNQEAQKRQAEPAMQPY